MSDQRNKNTCQARLRRAAVLAALAAVALLTACSGGSHPAPPGAGTGGPTARDVDAYMQCMRSHGMTNFYLSRPDSPGQSPGDTLGFMPYGVVLHVNFSSPQFRSANKACAHFIPGGPPPRLTHKQLAQDLKYVACLRVHGYPNWPDPVAGNGGPAIQIPAGVDVNSPQFRAAKNACSRQ